MKTLRFIFISGIISVFIVSFSGTIIHMHRCLGSGTYSLDIHFNGNHSIREIESECVSGPCTCCTPDFSKDVSDLSHNKIQFNTCCLDFHTAPGSYPVFFSPNPAISGKIIETGIHGHTPGQIETAANRMKKFSYHFFRDHSPPLVITSQVLII